MEATFLYAHGQQIGYGRMGVYIAQELTKLGVEVYDSIGRPTQIVGDYQAPADGTLYGTVDDPYRANPAHTNLMCLASVPSHLSGWYEGQHKACLTMWEAMTLPESFREILHEFDTILVPSWQNLDLFSQFHDNVHFIPLGVDPELWHYSPPPPADSTNFTFLISGRGKRKGTDLAHRAFREVFKGISGPQLIMKSLKGEGGMYGDNVRHITGMLDPIAERDLYASAHCYLQPSRGEGFGLQPLQAIASGRPTILTGAHGHESFAHLGIPLSSTAHPAEYFIYGDAGDWWEPDYDELCEAMWDVYQNYEIHARYAREASEEVAQHWTWRNTAEQFVQLLGSEMSPYTGSGTWQKPNPRLFKITVRHPWKGEIAGRSLRFEPGQEYWDLADVKRILFDAGFLSNECLEGVDLGLAEVQLADVPHVKGDNAYCPECHQRLNSGISRADEIFEQLEREAALR
jgi:glycosyltransferase involved in cell wall biosynthesis